jgi:3-oxoacyl-[acyl-carrier protein] reductase
MTLPAFSLEGRVALVTGAGRGIGAATAMTLASAGARVLIANRTGSAGESVAADIRRTGSEADAIECDVGLRDEIERAVSRTVQRFGALDIVVHNAGICPWVRLADLDDITLERTLAVNLKACFWLLQAAAPHLECSGRGRMLITSSVTGPRVAMPGSAHYAASKAGVNGFIRSAALEYAPRRITVNGVEPGYIAKDRGSLLADSERAARIAHFIPAGQLGEATDVAYALYFLATDAARYITGQTIVVDGGSTLPESPFFMEGS